MKKAFFSPGVETQVGPFGGLRQFQVGHVLVAMRLAVETQVGPFGGLRRDPDRSNPRITNSQVETQVGPFGGLRLRDGFGCSQSMLLSCGNPGRTLRGIATR